MITSESSESLLLDGTEFISAFFSEIPKFPFGETIGEKSWSAQLVSKTSESSSASFLGNSLLKVS